MLGWFAETTLVASGLAAVAALGGRVRSIGPAARHALWLVVLIKLMTPPLVCWPWAVAGWGADWSLFEPAAAHAAQIRTLDPGEGAGHGRSPARVSDPWPHAAVAHRMDLDPSFTGCGPGPGTFRTVAAASVEAPAVDDPISPGSAPVPGAWPVPVARLARGLAAAWIVVTVLLATGQVLRIVQFRGRLRSALPPPDDLVEEAGRIGQHLAVRVPELLVVPELGTPMLWCLGRPKLLLPAPLVKALDRDRWRGILIHELAHLRRGDHWVSRLELAAGLIWWWNPLYWLTRARLDAEAELACDAWVVGMLPKDRLAYAEALFDICSTMSLARSPAPALGAAGSGRFFERRLTMILHDYVPCRLSPFGLLAAGLLALFALPSWSAAKPVADDPEAALAPAPRATTVDQASTASVVDDVDDADDDDDNDDADDDDDDDQPAARKAKARAEAKAKAKADAKAKAKQKAKEHKVEGAGDRDVSKIEKEIESKFGPDFEKRMEELGEKIGKEMEEKFGPDFEKKMEEFGEKIGKEMEAKFGPGSDFEKKMKEFGKEMESKFGPGSDFEKKMKELGKEMESKFGPGSDFEKKMKALGEEMKEKYGPDSEFMKKLKEQSGSRSVDREPAKAKATRPGAARGRGEATAKAGTRNRQRERRIAILEDQIRKLAEELKALKAQDDQDDKDR